MANRYTKHVSAPSSKAAKTVKAAKMAATPQSRPLPDSGQVPNSAGGFSWAVDNWKRLDRFLLMGSEGGTYYVSERKLTRENAKAVEACITEDGLRVVKQVVAVSDAGRAPKNDPALFVLAMCMKLGDQATRKAAVEAVPAVARIGTHILHLAEYVQAFGGWGRSTRRAFARWFTDKKAEDLAFQVVKYQSRDKWSMRDLARLSHPKSATADFNAVMKWVVDGAVGLDVPEVIHGYESLKACRAAKDAARLITKYRLPRECVPTDKLNDPIVWDALLPHMGRTAIMRSLSKMTAIGLVSQGSDASKFVCERLTDQEGLKKDRIHPISVLVALKTYAQGHGEKGKLSWTPVQKVVDALDSAFYLAFKAVEPTNKSILLALDVSGSMYGNKVNGVAGLDAATAAAAMALVTANTEPNYEIMGFSHQLVDVPITPKMRLDQVVGVMHSIPMGGTDCALPMIWAREKKLKFDLTCVYTDSETWAGVTHPSEALKAYRKSVSPNAKLAVLGVCANEFTIADPNDAGMLDLVGFDSNVPEVLRQFVLD